MNNNNEKKAYKDYNKKKTFSYSADEEVIDKIKFIAKKEESSVNHLLHISLVQYIKQYEREFGEITTEEIESFKEKEINKKEGN